MPLINKYYTYYFFIRFNFYLIPCCGFTTISGKSKNSHPQTKKPTFIYFGVFQTQFTINKINIAYIYVQLTLYLQNIGKQMYQRSHRHRHRQLSEIS